jgi:hypothetical protein
MKLWKTVTFCVVCLVLVSCNSHSTVSDSQKYFESPASAVEQIAVMLKERNWAELASYYDLSDSPVERSTLISGEFFYTDEEPAGAHPAGFWHYKHPFPPAFKFHSTRDLEEPGVIEVTVQVEIDQGGGMIQRGMQTFLMRKTENGYQIMPHKAPVL